MSENKASVLQEPYNRPEEAVYEKRVAASVQTDMRALQHNDDVRQRKQQKHHAADERQRFTFDEGEERKADRHQGKRNHKHEMQVQRERAAPPEQKHKARNNEQPQKRCGIRNVAQLNVCHGNGAHQARREPHGANGKRALPIYAHDAHVHGHVRARIVLENRQVLVQFTKRQQHRQAAQRHENERNQKDAHRLGNQVQQREQQRRAKRARQNEEVAAVGAFRREITRPYQREQRAARAHAAAGNGDQRHAPFGQVQRGNQQRAT